MYRVLLRMLSAATLLMGFWSALRLQGRTLFDWAELVFVLAALPYRAVPIRGMGKSFKHATVGLFLLCVGGGVSAFTSTDPIEHLSRVGSLLLAFGVTIWFIYTVVSREILTYREALLLLCLSGTISSVFVLLQAQFGMFTYLIPDASNGIKQWSRFTGLAEHPIESGTTAAFAVTIALSFALRSRRWAIFLAPMIVCVSSMRYSAS